MGMGYGVGFLGGLISLALTVWFVYFSVMVLKKLDNIIGLLSKK